MTGHWYLVALGASVALNLWLASYRFIIRREDIERNATMREIYRLTMLLVAEQPVEHEEGQG